VEIFVAVQISREREHGSDPVAVLIDNLLPVSTPAGFLNFFCIPRRR
jgi:hypothetical protein